MDNPSVQIKRINYAGTIIQTYGREFTNKNRKYYGISFALNGEIIYNCGNEKYISNKDNVIFLPKGASYDLKCTQSGEFPLIDFECTNDPYDTFFTVPITDSPKLIAGFESIKNAMSYGSDKYRILSLSYSLLSDIFSVTGSVGRTAAAKTYIDKHFGDGSINNAFLAELCFMSEINFRKLFFEEYSVSPHKYLSYIRLSAAKRMLCESSDTIESIAWKCGYSSIFNFSRAFKTDAKITPSEFRRITRDRGI